MEIDYKKEYEAMVQRARELHETGNELTKRQMEIVCQELRESEDERIRKLLVWQVHRNIEDETNDLAQSVYDGIKGHDPDLEESIEDWKRCLAYLEKQKESLHISEACKENADSFTSACKDVIVAIEKYLDWLTGYPDYAPKGKYSIRDMLYCLSLLKKQKPENVSATTMAPSCWEVEQKEQKPVQLEEEKEYIRTLKSRVADFLRGKDKDEVDTTYYQRICDWLDGRHVEQKPAEWSEEDDQLIGFIFDLLNDLVWRKDWAMSKEECLKRLKSLRPPLKDKEMKLKILKYLSTRCSSLEFEEVEDYLNNLRPSWKPNEEQMDMLCRVCSTLHLTSGENKILESLYKDLYKLGVKEEPKYYQHFDPDC